MYVFLQHSSVINQQTEIAITGSKSESNRMLLLQALFPEIEIENLSNSDDTQVMQQALQQNQQVVNVHHAGTAMRFLTAYFSVLNSCEVTLTGSSRMQQRPIAVLVDALRELGADIQYLKNEGFPPLKIVGKKLTKNQVSLPANISSQYISALLLIAPKLKNGIELTLLGKITSVPYIEMTLALLNQIGVSTRFNNNLIQVKHQPLVSNQKITIESDWSSASYFYAIAAFCKVGTQITLNSYKKNTLQGDSVLVEIYKHFGVETTFSENKINLKKIAFNNTNTTLQLNLSNAPDIAQTIVVTCFGLGLACNITGLHTLKIKETDRLVALQNEIVKLGGKVQITNHSLRLEASKTIKKEVTIATYQDHRMAMAFAPLALKVPIIIENAQVVSKSYPMFWQDLKKLGFKVSQ